MLTLFAIPKAFQGHVGVIQRNAILSWMQLRPRPEIILLGDDDGTAEIAAEFGLKHIPNIARNEYGTPLMNSMFEVAQHQGTGPLFAYINADIILMSDFMQALQRVPFERFMLTGQRWNLDFNQPLATDSDWAADLRDRVAQKGQQEGPQAMDYFVFSRDTYVEVPPFAIGRLCFDNWMLYQALSLNIPVIDASEAIMAVHQNHDYNHHPEGREWIFSGPEAQRNLQLLGGLHHTYFMLDLASWQLSPRSLRRPPFSWQRLERQLDMLPLARPQLRPQASFALSVLRYTTKKQRQLLSITSKLLGIPARIVSRLRRVGPTKPSSLS